MKKTAKTPIRSKGTPQRGSDAAAVPVLRRDPYFAQVIGKAFRCVETIKRNPEPLTLTQIHGLLGGAKSSVFRILHTVESLGYIERDALGRYQPVAELREMDRTPYLKKLMRSAEVRMKRLVREFEETTSLASLFENHIEVVSVLESPHTIRMGNMVGRILQPHASSLGKCIAAFQSEERQDKLLRSYGVYRYTDRTITDAEELKQEYARIREFGWATDREETTRGGTCFGAPIFAVAPHAVGAISVSVPTMRLTDDLRERIVQEVCRSAAEISAELVAV